MNMTRYPVLRVHVILMPTRLWPTASAISSGVGLPASFAGMSATVPVAVPLGSDFGAGLGSSARTRLTSSTSNRTKEQSFTVRRMGDLLSLAIHRGPSTEGMLGVPRPDITLRGARALVRVIKAMCVGVLASSSSPLRVCTASLGSWSALQPKHTPISNSYAKIHSWYNAFLSKDLEDF